MKVKLTLMTSISPPNSRVELTALGRLTRLFYGRSE
jgi:hypothetical protein